MASREAAAWLLEGEPAKRKPECWGKNRQGRRKNSPLAAREGRSPETGWQQPSGGRGETGHGEHACTGEPRNGREAGSQQATKTEAASTMRACLSRGRRPRKMAGQIRDFPASLRTR